MRATRQACGNLRQMCLRSRSDYSKNLITRGSDNTGRFADKSTSNFVFLREGKNGM